MLLEGLEGIFGLGGIVDAVRSFLAEYQSFWVSPLLVVELGTVVPFA
jgi:hypothetical protein